MSGPRPGRRMWESRISLAPHPSMAEDRIRYLPSKNPHTGSAYPVCAFSGGRARSSVLGIRPSALIRSRVPGAGYPGRGGAIGQ